MKKILSVVVALGIVGIFLAVLYRPQEIAAPRPPANHLTKAMGSPATGPALSNAASPTQNPSGERTLPASIPLVDPTNPAYATMARQLDGIFRGMLNYYRRDQSHESAEKEATIRLLTTVRLSQMMHEATIATVTRSTAQSVTIAIPAYEAEGKSLQRYLEGNLPPSVASPDMIWEMTKDFDHFGRYKQEIKVSPAGQFRGETLYQIEHFTDLSSIFGGLNTRSTLPSSELGAYGVFQPLFPTP